MRVFMPGHRFEDWFSKYAKGKDGVDLYDVWDGLKGQRVIMDPVGWFGGIFECEHRTTRPSWYTHRACIGLSTYIMLWPEDGIMKKEDVRRVYDGSIFPDVAAKRANGTNQTESGKKAE